MSRDAFAPGGPSRILDGFPAPHVVSALPDFALAFVFLTVWRNPSLAEPDQIRLLLVMMVMEFIVVHSGGFFGAVYAGHDKMRAKLPMLGGLTLFYCLFAGAFSLAFRSWWPLASFLGLTANRLLVVLLDPRPTSERKSVVMANWGLTAFAYLMLVFATAMVPIPRLGFTSDVVRGLGLTGGGLWIDEPWRVMALGAAYFTAVGVIEIAVLPRIGRARAKPARHG